MTRLAESGIAERMANYLERQLAWIDDGFAFLDTLSAEPDSESLDAFALADARRARELGTFEHEFHALKKEWDRTSGIDAEKRAAVRALAARAEERSRSLSERLDGMRRALSALSADVETELSGLRVARQNARKFRQTDDVGGGFVDRQA